MCCVWCISGAFLNRGVISIVYTHCLYPHHAECIETRLVLMYPGILMHYCKKKVAVPSKILIKNSINKARGHCPTPSATQKTAHWQIMGLFL